MDLVKYNLHSVFLLTNDKEGVVLETKRLKVHAEGKHVYDILITRGFQSLAEELAAMELGKRKVCIVTEDHVAGLFLDEVQGLLADRCAGIRTFVFPEGESSKNLGTVTRLYEFLMENEFDRKDLLLALGGGVTGDLTGFAAASYLRGIDFVQVPTSLLAQVDSSIGGKTGVDFHNRKNMVGAFYMPKLVYINIDTLGSLSERQYHSGLGEVIKHGLIQDKGYYQWIWDHREEIARREPDTMAFMVEGSCKIKRAVVEEDPKEQGIRALLNYGHTLGHSIEKLMGFSLTHGECVGIGAILAAEISRGRGYISDAEFEEIQALFDYFDFPHLPEGISVDQIVEETRHDKKMEHGRIKFVLLDAIGQAGIHRDVSESEMKASFRFLS